MKLYIVALKCGHHVESVFSNTRGVIWCEQCGDYKVTDSRVPVVEKQTLKEVKRA